MTTPPRSGKEDTEIKTMKLYSHVERIDNELRARGMVRTTSETTTPHGGDGGGGAAATAAAAVEPPPLLDPEALAEIDSMHYEGDEGMKSAASAASLTERSAVLDVGSGFGGPARLLAHRTGCSVVALELQGDIHAKAAELTAMCGLDRRVTHANGNFLDCDLSTLGGGTGTFDAVVSWLVFLHIPDKGPLLGRCAEMLGDRGVLFADDFYMRGTFSNGEVSSLKEDVFCSDLPTEEEYVRAAEDAGFEDIVFEDKTADWTAYVNERLREFVKNRTRFEEVHGNPTYEQLLHFYKAMGALFDGGNLGGVRLCGKKKSTIS